MIWCPGFPRQPSQNQSSSWTFVIGFGNFPPFGFFAKKSSTCFNVLDKFSSMSAVTCFNIGIRVAGISSFSRKLVLDGRFLGLENQQLLMIDWINLNHFNLVNRIFTSCPSSTSQKSKCFDSKTWPAIRSHHDATIGAFVWVTLPGIGSRSKCA